MAGLGVTDFVRLGGDHRFRDSGMAWADDGTATARDTLREGIFWTTDLLAAANELVPLIRDRRPQVLVTYNEIGGYGHPDHIQAHRVAMYGYQLAAMPHYRPDLGSAWQVDRVLWTTMSETRLREGLRALRASGDTETFGGLDPEGPSFGPMAAPDEAIAVEIDGGPWVSRKLDAMRAHATQITAGRAVLHRHGDPGRHDVVARVLPARGRHALSRPDQLGRRRLRRPEARGLRLDARSEE